MSLFFSVQKAVRFPGSVSMALVSLGGSLYSFINYKKYPLDTFHQE